MPDASSTASPSVVPAGYFDDRVFVYKFLPADQTVANLALRFNVDETAIWFLNGHDSSWSPAGGELLQIPRPTEMRFGDFIPPGCIWMQYDVDEGTSLDALLQKLSANGHLGSFGADSVVGGNIGADEALAIWHYWRNAKLREDVLSRSPDAAGGTDTDWANLGPALPILDVVESKGASAAMLNASDVIFLPMTPLAEHEVAVAPGATATVDLTPTPLEKARRRLSAIHSLLQTLIGLRAEAQRIQAECTACLRILRQLHALIEAEQDQFDNPTVVALHPDHDDAGRAALKTALENLAQQATSPLLNNPVPTVSPGFPARWQRTMNRLVAELKNADLRQLLDQVIPPYGEMICVIDGVKDRKNFVETLCSLVAQAAYWIAESGTDEGTTLLNDAIAIMGSGAKPTADSTSSLIDYAAALVSGGGELSPSCDGSIAYAYCGVVTNLYVSAGLGSASLDPSVCASNVRSAIGTLLGFDPDVYWGGPPPLSSSGAPANPSDGPPFSSMASAVETSRKTATGIQKDATNSQASGEDDATVASFQKDDPDDDIVLARRYYDYTKYPERLLGPLAGPIGNLRSLWGVLKALDKTGDEVVGTFTGTTPSDRFKSALHAGQDGLGAASSSLKLLQSFGIVEEASIKQTVAICGRISTVLAIVLETVEAVEAFAVDDPRDGWTHLGVAAGLGLLWAVPGGQVILLIGGAVLTAANVVNSAPDFFTLESGAFRYFTKSLARLKATAGKFRELQDQIDTVSRRASGETFPVMDPLQYMAYQAGLSAEGIADSDVTN